MAKDSKKNIMPPCIVACNVFRSAMEHLDIQHRYPDLSIRYLPAHLHLQPAELKRRLLAEIGAARENRRTVGCLYGHCFEDIEDVLEEAGVPRIRVGHCFEILMGRDRYHQWIHDQAGTFFMEKELVENFEAYCWEPLELFDPQMRSWYFEHYRRVAYIRQPRDPDLTVQARRIAGSLDLELQIVEADYGELEHTLNQLIAELAAP
jgi:Protein of unknown function (DUF1638)